MFKLKFVAYAVLAAWLVTGCGGGGSGSAGVVDSSGPTTATVAVLMADSSADDAVTDDIMAPDEGMQNGGDDPDGERLLAVITSVTLMGDNGKQAIFTGSEEIDLFDLKDTLELFFVNETVTPGTFDKIRLEAENIRLFNEDYPEGEPVKLPSGHIDFNPRESFTIVAGDVVYITLDMYANKSLKLTENPQKIILRPVVFVDIDAAPAFDEGLVRVSGLVDSVGAGGFRLCEPNISARPLPASEATDGGTAEDDSGLNELCLDIVVSENTGLFGPDGMPVELADLMTGDPVTVIGLLEKAPEVAPLDDSDTAPTPFRVRAAIVEGGLPGTWIRERGTVESTADDTGLFLFTLADTESTMVEGQLYPKSHIYRINLDDGLTRITAGDLAAGDRAVVEAVRVPAPEPPEVEEPPAEESPEEEPPAEELLDTLRIALMLVVPGDLESLPVRLRGEILSVVVNPDNMDAGEIRLATDSGDRCVNVTEETIILQVIATGDELDPVDIVKAPLGDLLVGAPTAAVGVEDNGCLSAGLIISRGSNEPPSL